jgi:hypothetical protein
MHIQTDNGLGDLMFIGTSLAFFVLIIRIIYLIIVGRSRRRPTYVISGLLGVYIILLLATNLMTPWTNIAPGTGKCSDEWCATVSGASELPSLGHFRPKGRLIVVDVKIFSQSRGRTQKGSNPEIYLVDASGKWHPPSPEAQQALTHIDGPQPSLATAIAPGSSFNTRQAFEIPTGPSPIRVLIAENPGITKLIPFNEAGFLSGKAVFLVVPKIQPS